MRSAASRLASRRIGAARARRFQPTIAPPPSRADLRLALRHLREVVEVIDEEHADSSRPATFGLALSIRYHSSEACAPPPVPMPNPTAGSLRGAPVKAAPGHEPARRGLSKYSMPAFFNAAMCERTSMLFSSVSVG